LVVLAGQMVMGSIVLVWGLAVRVGAVLSMASLLRRRHP
jgi:hypothetical protein